MSDFELSKLDSSVLTALKRGFPVSQSPYCDIAADLGVAEIDVLNSAEKLREVGAVTRIAAVFSRTVGVQSSQADADLAEVVAFDLPWGEHPYAEVAAQLELRGTQLEEAQVIERLREWVADGTVSGVVAFAE